MAKFVFGPSQKVAEALAAVGLVREDELKDIARIVIDLKVGDAAMFYVQKFLDDKFADVVLAGGLTVEEVEE